MTRFSSFLSCILASLCLLSFAHAGAYGAPAIAGTLSKRLIETANGRAWLSERDILALIRKREKFMDITDFQTLGELPTLAEPAPIPKEPVHSDLVKSAIANISRDNMKVFLNQFTAFHTRYYKSQTGEQAAKYLLTDLQKIAATAVSPDVVVSVTPFKHDGWGQISIIARIAAKADTAHNNGPQKPILPARDDVVIVGCHIDSVNGMLPWFGRSPGADDNGSGTSAVREAFRILVQSEFVPSRPIEFHFNSAEEGGLLGSQAIASQYRKEGRAVYGMLQQDMNGFKGAVEGEKREVVGVGTDFVDDDLSLFLRKLIETYLQIRWVDTKCGYGCSDHASWFKQGYRTAFPFEAPFESHNPHIHTADDTVEYLSFKHIQQFVELILAFGIELSLA